MKKNMVKSVPIYLKHVRNFEKVLLKRKYGLYIRFDYYGYRPLNIAGYWNCKNTSIIFDEYRKRNVNHLSHIISGVSFPSKSIRFKYMSEFYKLPMDVAKFKYRDHLILFLLLSSWKAMALLTLF